MLLRGTVAAVALIASAGMILQMTQVESALPSEDSTTSPKPSLGLAPISLGNPATATALVALSEGAPHVSVLIKPLPISPESLSPLTFQSSFTVKSGDTLSLILKRAGAAARTAETAIRSLKGVYDPRRLKAGQLIRVTFSTNSEQFQGFEIPLDYARRIHVALAPEGGFKAFEIERELTVEHARGQGTIDISLFGAGSQAGVPHSVMAELVRAFSWDVDFQRDIRKNDAFEVMYERKVDENGTPVHNGRVLYASLTLSGDHQPIYLHRLKEGTWDFFDDKGQSAKKALMRTPIDGARLSSSYGKRRHPVLGYTKMHKGTDFAAPRGTPIYAAGDGTVIKSGRNGSFGNYVSIRHNSEYSTAYAHMKSIKRSAGKGRRVRQGEVIGYVGTTGRSTGPHLHYEILRNGRQTNPMRVKMPSGRKLKGTALAAFSITRDRVDNLWASFDTPNQRVAQR